MKIAITDRNNEIKDLNYRKNGLDITEDLVGFGPMPAYNDAGKRHQGESNRYSSYTGI